MADEAIPSWSPDYPLSAEADARGSGAGLRHVRIRRAVLALAVCAAVNVATGKGERLLAPAEASVASTSAEGHSMADDGYDRDGPDVAPTATLAAAERLPASAVRGLVEAVDHVRSEPAPERVDVPPDYRIPPAVASAIVDASRAVDGADSAFLMTLAAKESGFDPKAKSKRSSAEGLFQFVANTWLHVVRTHGPKHGLAHWAAKIAPDRKGVLTVRSAADRKAILALRRDPRINALMKAEHAAEEHARLAQSIGRKPTAFELYAAHLMGVPAAASAVKRGGVERARVSEAAARANPGIFAADGSIRAAAARSIERFVEAHMRRFAGIDAPARTVKQAMAFAADAP